MAFDPVVGPTAPAFDSTRNGSAAHGSSSRVFGLPTPIWSPPVLVREFTGDGGVSLRYSVVESGARRGSPLLVYMNGVEGHGGWFLPAAISLRDRGCTTILLDRRGSGLNGGRSCGHVRSAEVLLRDIRLFRESVGDPEVHFVGQSWGGKVALAAALDRPERVKSVVLVTPGLRTLHHLSPLDRVRAAFGLLLGSWLPIRLPLSAGMFTRFPDRRRLVEEDPWRVRSVTARFLLASRRLDGMIARRLSDLRIPVLLFLAGLDPIVDNRGVMDVLRPLSRLRVRVFSRAVHSLPLDEATLLAREMADFLGDEAEDPG